MMAGTWSVALDSSGKKEKNSSGSPIQRRAEESGRIGENIWMVGTQLRSPMAAGAKEEGREGRGLGFDSIRDGVGKDLKGVFREDKS